MQQRVENLKGRFYLQELGIDVRIILRWILNTRVISDAGLTQNLWLMPRRYTIRCFKYYTSLVSLYVYRVNAMRVTAGESNLVFTSTVRLD
jgi:hypothetical protein